MAVNNKFWRITNNTGKEGTPSAQEVKVVIRVEPNASKSIFLKPGKFVVGMAQITTSLDAQSRKNFVKIDYDFDNSLDLELGEQYDLGQLEKIEEGTNDYIN